MRGSAAQGAHLTRCWVAAQQGPCQRLWGRAGLGLHHCCPPAGRLLPPVALTRLLWGLAVAVRALAAPLQHQGPLQTPVARCPPPLVGTLVVAQVGWVRPG
jgi:hypothetical protein